MGMMESWKVGIADGEFFPDHFHYSNVPLFQSILPIRNRKSIRLTLDTCHSTLFYQLWNGPGPAAKQPDPPSGQRTTKTLRCPHPATPIVYSARWIPFTNGPCSAG